MTQPVEVGPPGHELLDVRVGPVLTHPVEVGPPGYELLDVPVVPVLTHPVEVGLPGYELLDVRVGPVGVDAVHHLLLHLQSLQERLAVSPLLYQLRYRRV